MSMLLPFFFENLPVRGRLIRLSTLNAHVPSLRGAPPATAQALSELLALAALLLHEGENENNISLQIQHQQSGALLFARISTKGEMKAYANEAAGSETTPWADGTALFAVTLEPEKAGDPIQSILPLDNPSPAACLRRYFTESVQIPTQLIAARGEDTAAILMLQALPGLDESGDDWHRLNLMLQTATAEEMLPDSEINLTATDLIKRLFAEDDLRVEPEQALTFSAHNPRTAMLTALASLPAEDIRHLLESGPIEMEDKTTGGRETFTEADLQHLLQEGHS
ncbi:MAG: hypothetical protein COY40_02260 [Alphaproteobacteria bacterium CG_4_10_14_0_8_um_filter_53_9]|nr:MAG: hypothetical protein COY40_02260 [Alphaproteobacteria bacterium CG_4_10_14_0_8_um_filter_53_9]